MKPQLQFYIGKGGVGKSTTSAITSVHLSQKSFDILLVSMDPAHNQRDIFQLDFREKPKRVTNHLVVKEVNVPVIGGGGVCDGKGLVAMLAFGALGIYVGTRFIVTKECEFNDKVKEEIIAASVKYPKKAATIVTQGVYGPLRHLKNKYSLKLFELTQKMQRGEISMMDVLLFETEGTYRAKGPEGNIEDGAIWAGQASLRIHEMLTCKELISQIMNEAHQILSDFNETYSKM